MPGAAERIQYPLGRARPVRMSAGERFVGLLFFLWVLLIVAAMAYGLISYFGFEALMQLHGFDVLIDEFDIEPPPKL